MTAKKILIIDDDAEFLYELKEALQMSGYDVAGIDDATHAVDTALKMRPDLILLDLRMPRVSGFEIADSLKRLTEISNIPVVAMTGHYTVREHSWLMDFCGIKKCLKKPFSAADLTSTVDRMLKNEC